MNAKRINLALGIGAAACAAGAIGAIVLGLVLPLANSMDQKSTNATRPGANQTIASAVPPLSAFDPIFNRPLRQALGDEPSAPAAAPVARKSAEPATPPPFTLVGTVGNSLALLRGPDGKIELKGVGESAGGMKVVAIRPAQIDVQQDGRVVTLSKPKEPPPGG